MEDKLKKALKDFEAAERLLLELGEAVLQADDTRFFPLDMFVVGALRRSLALLQGFKLLIESRNFVSAVPLLRLQLDNSLRFFATTLVDDPHQLVITLMEGKQINQMKDRDDKKMSDGYLVENLSQLFPWIGQVYKNTSGFIHLSEKHVFMAIQVTEKVRQVSFHIAGRDSDVFPASAYLEATEAFLEATRVFAKLLGSWLHCKEKAGRERPTDHQAPYEDGDLDRRNLNGE